MKLLIDQCLSVDWIACLADEGFEAVRWESIGEAADPDFVILEYAADHDFVLLTRDLDFSNLLAWLGASKPSVIQIRSGDSLPDTASPIVIRALRTARDALLNGAIVSIDVKNHKVRVKSLS